jgi:hypothetical protein
MNQKSRWINVAFVVGVLVLAAIAGAFMYSDRVALNPLSPLAAKSPLQITPPTLTPSPTATQTPTPSPTPVWIECGDFECAFHIQDGIGEVQVPEGWRAWWMEPDCPPGVADCYNLPCMPWEPGCYVQCPLNCTNKDRHGNLKNCIDVDYGCWWARPEFRDTADPNRVFSLLKAQKYFSFGRMSQAGLYQQIHGIPIGSLVQFSLWVEGWQCRNYADCCKSGKPCVSDFPYAMNFQVGIDPTGGTDPTAPSVIWSPASESFDHWSELFVSAVALSDTITVFTGSQFAFDWARINNDGYLDAPWLRVIENPHFVYLPAMMGGQAQPTPAPAKGADLTKSAIILVPDSITLTVGQTRTIWIVAENMADAIYASAVLSYSDGIIGISAVEVEDFLAVPYSKEVREYLGVPENAGTAVGGILFVEALGIQTGSNILASFIIEGLSPGVATIAPKDRSWCFVGVNGPGGTLGDAGGINPQCYGARVVVR